MLATDQVDCNAVVASPDGHWLKFSSRIISEANEFLTRGTTCDVDSDIAFEIKPPEAPNEFCRYHHMRLIGTVRAFMVKLNNLLTEGGGEQLSNCVRGRCDAE